MQTVIECDYRLGQKLYGKKSGVEYEVVELSVTKCGRVHVVLYSETGCRFHYHSDVVPQEFSATNPDDVAFARFRDTYRNHTSCEQVAVDAWNAALLHARSQRP